MCSKCSIFNSLEHLNTPLFWLSRRAVLQFFQPADVSVAYPKRDNAKKAKGAIDKPPVHRNAPDGPGNKGQWKHHYTGNHAILQHPNVSNRVP